MQKAPIPIDEESRMDSLRKLEILDTPPEERFDRITKTATLIFNVPISTLTMVDSKREWFKSVCGLDQKEGDRAISFCGHVVVFDDVFVVPDTLKDNRFKDNPMVVGEPFIRFYAGVPIHGPDGERVGVLCIKGKEPKEFSKNAEYVLKSLATWAELELNSKNLGTIMEHERKLIAMNESYAQEINRLVKLLPPEPI